MTFYAATTNPGKLRDFAHAAGAHLLNGQPIRIEPLPNLAQFPAPPEDAPTFAGNARAKALYYASHSPGLLVLADDSGLEVDALSGAPGVRSARYADDLGFHSGATIDDRNNALLLSQLLRLPLRTARYRCALALARSTEDKTEILATAEGALEGSIATIPRGVSGFGYDPIFLVPSLNLTMAELDPTTRLTLSHRGRALRALLQAFPPHQAGH